MDDLLIAMLMFRGVPALICCNCGEDYVDESTIAHLLEIAEASVRARVQMEVREYAVA